jgi:hypothetical protein
MAESLSECRFVSEAWGLADLLYKLFRLLFQSLSLVAKAEGWHPGRLHVARHDPSDRLRRSQAKSKRAKPEPVARPGALILDAALVICAFSAERHWRRLALDHSGVCACLMGSRLPRERRGTAAAGGDRHAAPVPGSDGGPGGGAGRARGRARRYLVARCLARSAGHGAHPGSQPSVAAEIDRFHGAAEQWLGEDGIRAALRSVPDGSPFSVPGAGRRDRAPPPRENPSHAFRRRFVVGHYQGLACALLPAFPRDAQSWSPSRRRCWCTSQVERCRSGGA